ncbi:hypothetical protein F511_28349 [Dorcoceras hygrometricum]|uniref:Uncharacterized protein n=1 Tax=Dorcoceras hygrometricum TaxID=472368 RepID=A0A2Z7BPQ4_9LAMI|nr:hypothetical protein F511_28349 [Dorcoceras hygrometricum]
MVAGRCARCCAAGSLLAERSDAAGRRLRRADYATMRDRRVTVRADCGRLRQSGPRPETGFPRQPALEGLTRSVRTDSPRQDWPETIFRRAAAAAEAEAASGARRRRREVEEWGGGG